MGKTTSLIESQHHHLLHCLEKTTVSPSPRHAHALPFQGSELTSSSWPSFRSQSLSPSESKAVMRSLSTLGRRPPRSGQSPRWGQLCPAAH